MIQPEGTQIPQEAEPPRKRKFDMEELVGSILLGGVLLCVGLILAGVTWNLAVTGHMSINYDIKGTNLFHFAVASFSKAFSGRLDPQGCINLGIVFLMLTPYVRVLASMIYFAAGLHNWKYTIFTGFVLALLTYSLFLR